jgi:hypothetical protein
MATRSALYLDPLRFPIILLERASVNFNPLAGYLGRIVRTAVLCGGGLATPIYTPHTWYRN